MDLSDHERDTLRALLSKGDGQAIAFVNIADARALTARGFAVRSGQGWNITDAGRAHLNARSAEPSGPWGGDDGVVAFDPPAKPRP
jgi:hypothetical protein